MLPNCCQCHCHLGKVVCAAACVAFQHYRAVAVTCAPTVLGSKRVARKVRALDLTLQGP